MARSQNYWTTEKGFSTDVGRNRIVHYPEAGVLQTYLVMPGTANGVGKGVSFHLDTLSEAELLRLKAVLTDPIEQEFMRRSALTGGK